MDLPLLSGGRRLDCERLPAAVRQGLQARLGSPVVHAATQPRGFSPGLAARLRLADGQRVFVKAAGRRTRRTSSWRSSSARLPVRCLSRSAEPLPPPIVMPRPTSLVSGAR
jgi:hypothetical protein